MKVRLLGLVAALALATSHASAAEPSTTSLAEMGLAGLEIMSDSESMLVRGYGYSGTSANGRGFAKVSAGGGSAGSENSYSAKGGKYSAGKNGSIAAVIVVTDGGHGGGGGGYSSKGGKGGGHGGGKPQNVSVVAFSGGFSVAKTKR